MYPDDNVIINFKIISNIMDSEYEIIVSKKKYNIHFFLYKNYNHVRFI